MEFLVRSENRLPPETPAERREELRSAERARAMELRAAGILKRLWRVPGRNATIGLYEADDPARCTTRSCRCRWRPGSTSWSSRWPLHPQERT